MEPGAFGSFVGRLDLVVENGKIIDDRYHLIEADVNKYKSDTEVASVIKQSEQQYVDEINKVVGYSTIPL